MADRIEIDGTDQELAPTRMEKYEAFEKGHSFYLELYGQDASVCMTLSESALSVY